LKEGIFAMNKSLSLPKMVKIVEVGPRDGLQNEPGEISTETKLAFIQQLKASGLNQIEVTSFVNPKRIPQLADAAEVLKGLGFPLGEVESSEIDLGNVVYSALVPNEKGLERAMASGVKRIAVFTAASNTFTHKNINMSISESLAAFQPVVKTAVSSGMSVRGYVSTCFVCPYEGEINPNAVGEVTERLLEMGVDEVSLGDTIGAAAPVDIYETVGSVLSSVPVEKIALHFHDTYGTALANVLAGLELGITTFDSSAGGLGGCPYAPGASGNLATEDLVYFLHRMGIQTGVDLETLAQASWIIERALGRELPSKQLKRLKALEKSSSSSSVSCV
jgi:hydroxymethylglutaryl-CoA lyase